MAPDFRRLIMLLTVGLTMCISAGKLQAADSLWALAQAHRNDLVISVLFTNRDMNSTLSVADKLQEAIAWCKNNGITKVYLETFRGRAVVPRDTMVHARDAFRQAGFTVSGCVTTVNMGERAVVRDSTGQLVPDQRLSCYSRKSTQDTLQRVFEYTASLFDEIIIDDFYCTDCECDTCVAAKGQKSWPEFRTDLMLRMSNERILAPAKKVNPQCRVIIKYPNWYDHYQMYGYDVDRQSKTFDHIYSGTETREPDSTGWSNPQYQAYFTMRWITAAGGTKNLGGWFDYIGTKPKAYVEQARQSVLGGAGQLMLFSYGPLTKGGGAEDVAALRQEIPLLFKLAAAVKAKKPRGILAPKPVKSSDEMWGSAQVPTLCAEDQYLFGFLGMLGLPLVPAISVPTDVQSVAFTRYALYDENILAGLPGLIARGVPMLVTDGLAREPGARIKADAANVHVLDIGDKREKLISLPPDQLDKLRDALLAPWGITFHCPARVGLYLYADDLVVVENFNDQEVKVEYAQTGLKKGNTLLVIPEKAAVSCQRNGTKLSLALAPRSLAAITIK